MGDNVITDKQISNLWKRSQRMADVQQRVREQQRITNLYRDSLDLYKLIEVSIEVSF